MAINTTSFAKTPQATDDTYSFSEADLQNSSTSNILVLDVMANDLGGNAKALYSVDDGGASLTEILQGLVQSDVGKEMGGTTQKGALLKLVDGRVQLDLTPVFSASTTYKSLDQMGASDKFVDTFTYAIRLANGTLSWATVTYTITGTNDAPKVEAALTVTATEDGTASTVNALQGASDVDTDTTLLVVNVPAQADLPAGVSYDAATKSFALDPKAEAYQALAEGKTTTVSVNYGISDGKATTPQSITWTVTGTNDAPKVESALTGAATEDGTASTVNALAGASDVDTGTTLSVVNVPAQADLPAGVSYDAATKSFTLDPKAEAYQALAEGKTTTVSVSYGISDGKATTPQSITWTVRAPTTHPRWRP